MRITWHCEKCGSIGSNENRSLRASSVNEGRIARMMHDAVSPHCAPEPIHLRVRVVSSGTTQVQEAGCGEAATPDGQIQR